MVSSQETAEFVIVEIVWLGQSPGHRRLRFSFQFNDVKDPTGSRPPHCLAPVAGGGGYLVADLFGVNRPFQAFPPHPESHDELPKFGAKITAGLRGTTPNSVAIRLELGKIPIRR